MIDDSLTLLLTPPNDDIDQEQTRRTARDGDHGVVVALFPRPGREDRDHARGKGQRRQQQIVAEGLRQRQGAGGNAVAFDVRSGERTDRRTGEAVLDEIGIARVCVRSGRAPAGASGFAFPPASIPIGERVRQQTALRPTVQQGRRPEESGQEAEVSAT